MEFEKPLSPLHTNDITEQDSFNLFPLLDASDEPTNWLNFDDVSSPTQVSSLDPIPAESLGSVSTCTICGQAVADSGENELG
jgi:hypothetical protein